MKEPVRVLSDLHLGHRISRISEVEALRPLVAGAGTVVFNGDTWQELADSLRERSAVMLEDLRGMCEEEGVEAVFLPGNHDPGWDGDGWVELAGGRVVVTHGDSLYFDGSPWKREVMRGRERVLELWRKRPEAERDPRERMKLAREISLELCSEEYPSRAALGPAGVGRGGAADAGGEDAGGVVSPGAAGRGVFGAVFSGCRDFGDRAFPFPGVLDGGGEDDHRYGIVPESGARELGGVARRVADARGCGGGSRGLQDGAADGGVEAGVTAKGKGGPWPSLCGNPEMARPLTARGRFFRWRGRGRVGRS